jgi:predicted Zn-dependent peptidase
VIATLFALAAVGPQLTRLPNGIPVVVETNASATVTVQVLVDIDDLTPTEAGAAEFMAAALFGETENYSLRELQRLAWSIGGSVASESAGDCLRLQVTTTRDRLRPTAAFISDALRRPSFSPEALADARRSESNRHNWIDRTPPLRDIRTQLAQQGHGPANVFSLNQEQAKALHAKVVRPERVAIGVVGAVSADDVATIFGASLGHWRAEETPRSVPAIQTQARGASGIYTALATLVGPTPNSPYFAAWMTACIALGEGKLGRLHQTFRLSSSIYVLGSYFTFREKRTYCTFYVASTVDPRQDELNKTVGRFEPTEAETQRAKAYLAGRYQVGGPTEIGRFGAFSIGHETEAARAFWLAWWELRGAGFNKDASFLNEIQALSHDSIANVIREWYR